MEIKEKDREGEREKEKGGKRKGKKRKKREKNKDKLWKIMKNCKKKSSQINGFKEILEINKIRNMNKGDL